MTKRFVKRIIDVERQRQDQLLAISARIANRLTRAETVIDTARELRQVLNSACSDPRVHRFFAALDAYDDDDEAAGARGTAEEER
jgi:hypothetical protein